MKCQHPVKDTSGTLYWEACADYSEGKPLPGPHGERQQLIATTVRGYKVECRCGVVRRGRAVPRLQWIRRALGQP